MTPDNMDDSSNLLCLCWNDHMENILNVFMEQLTTENLVDVTIMCEGQFIKAHKMILSACSPYLHEILTMHNVAHPVIIMNNVKFSDMKLIIEFMYCGQIKVSVGDFKNLVSLAQSLKVKGLSDELDVADMEGIENCVESIIQETPPKVKKRKIVDESCNGRMVRRRKRQSRAEPVVESEPFFVEQPTKDIKIEPLDTDDSNSRCMVDESNSHNFEFWDKKDLNHWLEDDDRKPEKGLLHYLKTCTGDAGTRRKKMKSLNSARIKKDGSGDGPSEDTPSPEQHKVRGHSDDIAKSHRSTSEDRIRRPPNAFMIFSNEWRKKLAKIYEFESNAGISRRLGEMWNSLEQKEKDVYFNAARLADLEHKEKYPGYHYSPQKARLRKRSQTSQKKALQFSSVRFAKVFMTDENNASIPVLIALNNPEVPLAGDKDFKVPKDVDDGAEKQQSRKRSKVA